MPHSERVAVRLRALGAGDADGAGGAGDVLDDDGLAEPHADRLRHDPAQHVGRSAGRQRHDEVDRTRRVIFGTGRRCKANNDSGDSRRNDRLPDHGRFSRRMFPLLCQRKCRHQRAKPRPRRHGSALPARLNRGSVIPQRDSISKPRCPIDAPQMSSAGWLRVMPPSSPRPGRRRAKAAWPWCRSPRSRLRRDRRGNGVSLFPRQDRSGRGAAEGDSRARNRRIAPRRRHRARSAVGALRRDHDICHARAAPPEACLCGNRRAGRCRA